MATMPVMGGRRSDLMSGLWTIIVYPLKILMDIFNASEWVGLSVPKLLFL